MEQPPWGNWASRKPLQRQPAWGWGLHLAETGVLSEAGAEQGCPGLGAVGTERKVPGALHPSHEERSPTAHRQSRGTHLAPDPQNSGSPVAPTSNCSPLTTPTWEASCKLQLQRPPGRRPQTFFCPVLIASLHPSARGSSSHGSHAQATSVPSREGPRPPLLPCQPGCTPQPPAGRGPPYTPRAGSTKPGAGGQLSGAKVSKHRSTGLWSPVNLKKGEAGPGGRIGRHRTPEGQPPPQ